MEQASQAAEKSREKNKPAQNVLQTLDSPEDTWFGRLMRTVEQGRPMLSAGGLSLSCYAWEACERSWEAIDKGVQMMPNKQARTELFHAYTLSGIVDAILRDQSAFHITWTPKDEQSLLENLTHILQAESSYGGFAKYLNGKWNGDKIIADLDKQITEKGRHKFVWSSFALSRLTFLVLFLSSIRG